MFMIVLEAFNEKVLQIFLFTIRRIVSIIELGRAITRPLWQENYEKVINIENII